MMTVETPADLDSDVAVDVPVTSENEGGGIAASSGQGTTLR